MSRLSRQVLPVETYLAKLTAADWATLKDRKVLLKGKKGQYGVMVATPVDAATAWAVLTDYGNFHRFLPTVAQSQVIETDGHRTVVEQVDRRRILLSTVESTVRTENLEIDRQQISFRLLQGNLDYMYGHWRIDPAPNHHSPQPLLLVSQQVAAEADLGPFKGMFYSLFETSLVETMQAIRQEMERRARSQPF
ncbi:MAG TPA: SRPBCC family protein [Leptolyngbyaceae cyanobacterium M65_K2018_010]|nr:SRPBCC family protein [Leptolyngbyaceae cyanobacterium M65_K2018_010]